MKELEELLGIENVKYNEPMKKHTSFRVGGDADIYVIVDSEEKLIKLIEIADNKKIPITVVGNGTNLLVKDEGIEGIVVRYKADNISLLPIQNREDKYKKVLEYYEEFKEQINVDSIKEDQEVIVDSGALNAKLAQVLLENELTGFEFASGIPGTIGGAVVMNAGAYGNEIKDVLIEVKYVDLNDKKIYTISNEECVFSYRSSIFQIKNAIVLSAKFRFKKGNKNDIKRVMDEYRKKRLSTQPLDKFNAGSTFKRGDGFITAQLIDEAGLKGMKVGDAEVSTKHAGFIVNNGNATANDLLELIQRVKDEVYKKFNKKIELEVRILGR